MASMCWKIGSACVVVGWTFAAATIAQGPCETATLVPADGAAGDLFGASVAISGDTMIVGAPLHNHTTGAAYVYLRTPLGWVQQAKLGDFSLTESDEFGRAVSISGDHAAVGTPRADVFGRTDAGRVYMFRRTGTNWAIETFGTPAFIALTSEFGTSVSVDGDAVLIGAPLTDEVSIPPNNFGNSGSAYVFRRNAANGVWIQEAPALLANDASELDQFGFNALLHGNTAFVTAFNDKDPNIHPSNSIGSVHVFTNLNGTWTQTQKLVASDAAVQAMLGSRNFGRSLSSDGQVLLVGERSGQSAYVFRFNGVQWVEEAILKKPAAFTGIDQFGHSVGIQGDVALVGAPTDDDNGLSNSGSVFAFRRVNGTWVFDSIYYGSAAASNDRLGASLAVDGPYAVAGAIQTSFQAIFTGFAYVLAVQAIPDCNGNAVQDECELHADPSLDMNQDGYLDACECTIDDECDDGQLCTEKVCNIVLGRCEFPVITGFCLITGTCYADGAGNPNNECQLCAAAFSPSNWSNRTDHTVCTSDANECTSDICLGGICSHPGEPVSVRCGDPSDTVCDNPDTCSGTGQCLNNYASPYTPCADLLFCNGTDEICNGWGVCILINPPPCVGHPILNLCDEANNLCVQCFTDAECAANTGECATTFCDPSGLCRLPVELIGTPCGDAATTDCSMPDMCVESGACAPNHLLDGLACSPDADPCTFDVCVAGTCTHPYEYPAAECGESDCNCNGVVDSCDITIGTSEDCNGNEVPDECDLPLFAGQSPQLSPIGAGFAQSFTLVAPPRATDDVTLSFTARGDFLALSEKVTVTIDGVAAGEVFTFNGLDCPLAPDEDALVLPAAQFNLATGSGDAVITMTATATVDAALCMPPSWIAVSVSYRGVQTGDCNGNAEFDTCEVQAGTQPDCNYNHVPDICEPDCDADGVPDACALYYYPANDKDCNNNGIPDRCDVFDGESVDCNANLMPDECEYDCQPNGIPDDCDIAVGTSPDCDDDQTPDECLSVSEQMPHVFTDRLAVDGNMAVSGAPGFTVQAGKAFILERSDNGWQLTNTIVGDFLGIGSQFGAAVDVRGDRVVIGAPSHEVNSVDSAGSVHVYENVGASVWIAEAHLADETVGMNARLGSSVAIAGEWMLAGAPGASVALMFRRENGVWTQHSRWIPPVVSVGFGRFGQSVSLDGNWAAVGELAATIAGTVVGGALHLYHFDGQGWNYAQFITSPEPLSYDEFGFAVVLENDRLIVSARSQNPPAGNGRGTAFVFRNESGFWTQEAELVAQNRGPRDYFGTTLALNDPYVVVAAPGERLVHHHSGVAYVFRRTQSNWTQVSKLGFPRIREGYGSRFADAVGVAGTKVLITEAASDSAFEFEFMPPSCHCPVGPVAFVDPPSGLIDARQPFELSSPAQPQGIDRFIIAQDEHSGTDCWLLSPSILGIPGVPIDGVAYNGDGTYTITSSQPTLPGVNQLTYTDTVGAATSASIIVHPGNVDGGPYADADDVTSHMQCCLGETICGPEYDKYRCDLDHSDGVSAEDLVREIDLLNGAGGYSPQLGTALPIAP